MEYDHLSQQIAPGRIVYTEAWMRVLSRLGDYTRTIVQQLNMRPTAVSLLEQTSTHLLIRISTPGEHLVLRIAPEVSLVNEVFFGRTMAAHRLPAARLAHYNLKRTLVPFDYLIEHYVGGIGAEQIDHSSPHLLRYAARQVGRTLRRMHRVTAPGWGKPSPSGRWLTPDWQTVLTELHTRQATLSIAALVFSQEEQQSIEALLAHPALLDVRPCLLHGAIGPRTTRCTIGDHVQVEALIDPGAVVAGDAMLDLALALDPACDPAWSQGLLEGYNSIAPLTSAEQERLHFLQLLAAYWSTCQRYALAEPHEAAYEQTMSLLTEHRATLDTLRQVSDVE